MATIKRGRVSSIEEFEKQFEKKERANSGIWPIRVDKNRTSLVVRFLTDPSGWVWYQQYWDQALKRTVIATEENEEEYEERGIRPTTVFLAPAILVENNQIVVVELRWSLAEAVKAVSNKYEEKFGSITNYDVELERTGTTKDDVKYHAYYEPGGAKLDLARYEIPEGHSTWQEFLWSVAERLADNGEQKAEASLPDDTDLGEDNADDGAEKPRRVVKRKVSA